MGDPVFVTTIYGASYAPFLAPHLHSIGACHPGSRGVVLWQDIPAREIETLRAAFPAWTFTETDRPIHGELHQRIPRKLHAWLAACDGVGDDAPICFVDCDTLLVRPLTPVLEAPGWDVIYTWKDEAFPINTGVIAARGGTAARTLLTELAARVERIVSNPEALSAALGSSGAADQHALRELVGWVNYDRDTERTVGGARLRFRGVPCRVLNETNCRPIGEDLRLIHYKTGWHPILLQGAPFTRNRPQDRCREMHEFWSTTEHGADRALARRVAMDACRVRRHRFAPLADGYEERGILSSEMLAVCALSEQLGADVVIESGRCRGQSTAMLARYFEGSATRIVSMELERGEDADFAESRLSRYPHVELLYGDSLRIIPELLAGLDGRRVSLLLDGPKGNPAIDFIERVFAEHANVIGAFLHDMRRGTPQRERLDTGPWRVFFTDDGDYVEAFGPLDRACLPPAGAPITVHTWRPWKKGEDDIPSYGPTLACLLPRPAKGARTHQEQYA